MYKQKSLFGAVPERRGEKDSPKENGMRVRKVECIGREEKGEGKREV